MCQTRGGNMYFEPLPFEATWLDNVDTNVRAVEAEAETIVARGRKLIVYPETRVAWALKALTLTDLTTLSGDDTVANVRRLVVRAIQPLPPKLLDVIFENENAKDEIHTAAVCVYPARVADASTVVKEYKMIDNIQVAAVATGFPSGQYMLETRLAEIKMAIDAGATEIDVVINRCLALSENWQALYDEIVAMRRVCDKRAHLKTILAIGELGTMTNVYKASMVAMMAGSDFIKTSTGKESVNATLPVGLVMIRAIENFARRTKRKVGLKPAGGVRTVGDAIDWMILVKETLGVHWLQPTLFRFGASGLLDDIEKTVLAHAA